MYYRLMLPELLPEDVDRILYLDIDVIVNQNIADFYKTDFGGKLLIATKDPEVETFFRTDAPEDKERNRFFKRLIAEGMTYFCSGVIIFHIEELRKSYSFQKYMEIFSTIRDKVSLPDQDLLNYVHKDEVKLVDEKKYGLFTQTAHQNGMIYEEAKREAVILHFTGQAKPWTVNLVRYDIEKIWWEYAEGTPYYDSMLRRVFYQSMESTLAEETMLRLSEENEHYKELLLRYQKLVEQLSRNMS